MVERGSGSAFKIAPSLTLLNENVTITPSYEHYNNTYVPISDEYDLAAGYTVPEVRGLKLFGGFGFLSHVNENGNGVYQAQLMASYLY